MLPTGHPMTLMDTLDQLTREIGFARGLVVAIRSATGTGTASRARERLASGPQRLLYPPPWADQPREGGHEEIRSLRRAQLARCRCELGVTLVSSPGVFLIERRGS